MGSIDYAACGFICDIFGSFGSFHYKSIEDNTWCIVYRKRSAPFNKLVLTEQKEKNWKIIKVGLSIRFLSSSEDQSRIFTYIQGEQMPQFITVSEFYRWVLK